jgi:hypothetical protein
MTNRFTVFRHRLHHWKRLPICLRRLIFRQDEQDQLIAEVQR